MFLQIAITIDRLFNGYKKGEITTTNKQENINISSNINSKRDMSLTSNFNNQQNANQVQNDINIKASNVNVKNTLTINTNGEDFNIKSANNTEKVETTSESYSMDLGKIAAGAAIEGAITGAMSGFLAGVAAPLVTGEVLYINELDELVKVNTKVPYLTDFLQIGKNFEIPLIKISPLTYPISTISRTAITAPIEFFAILFKDFTPEETQTTDNSLTNGNQTIINTVNSNINYGNLVVK